MSDDSVPSFSFPAICRKKVTAAFDGGRLTSDGGVLLLAQAERQMGICERLAACIAVVSLVVVYVAVGHRRSSVRFGLQHPTNGDHR